MAENTSERSSTGIAVIVGGLVVAVLVIGYFILGGNVFGTRDVDVEITVPAAPAQPPAAGTTTQ